MTSTVAARLLVAGFLAVSAAGSTAADVVILHVAPSSTSVPPTGTTNAPFTSLNDALSRAREVKRAASTPAQTIIKLHGGLYSLDRPIELTAEDSGGSDSAPLVIEAVSGETPVLSGGRRITGWKPSPDQPGAWTAPARSGTVRSLFVNGRRAQRARTPNEGFFRIQGPSPHGSPAQFVYRPGDLQPNWAAAGDVEVIALLAWADFRMFLRNVDETRHVATLSTDPRPSNQEANARYFIENAPDGCDAPGEWRLDARTERLTYRPQPGEDPGAAEVMAPDLDELLILRGDVAGRKPLRHVVLRGLTFSHTDWRLPVKGYADTQAAIQIRGDIRAECATDIRITGCRFQHLAGYGLELGRGCQRFRVDGNEMSDLGAGGLRIGETSRSDDPFLANHDHRITDNHLHALGRVYPPAVGILILQSGTNRVAHNHIHDLYYTAISVGWNWGYQETPCRGNQIEFNHLHHIGQGYLSDMGAIYTLGIQHGTRVRNNVIHDVQAFTYGGWGLYPDEGTTATVWENNLVYRCKNAGFHQHYGRDNLIRNNIFAFNLEHQLMRTREEPHLSFVFTNNIVFFNTGDLLGSNWKNDRFVIDGNLYWDARLSTHPLQLRFAGATWDEWRRRGHDTRSLVADPRFVDPARDDFRLQADSPARTRGFQPLLAEQAGIRPTAERD